VRTTVDPGALEADEVFHYSIPSLDTIGDGTIEPKSDIGSNKLLLRGGEVLISKLNPRISRVFMASAHAVPTLASTEFIALVPGPEVESRFLRYWLQSEVSRQYLDGATMSVTRSQQRVRPEVLTGSWLEIPSVDQQMGIADYLDRETRRIDALIAAKQRMTELLEEKRRAMRDLTLNCAPGWRLKRLLAGSMAYGVLVPDLVEPGTGVPMIRTYNLSARGYVSHANIAEIPAELAGEYQRTSLREGDVILSVVGSMGRSAVVSPQEQGFNLNRPLARLQLRPEVPPRLIWHWTQTTHFLDMAKLATGGGTAQPTLNLGDLANFRVGLPEDMNLWPAVLAELEEGCRRLDEAEDVLNRQIGLLQERRQALITAAVTGELEIPEAA
jgi:type I restriction enzyme S subunit